MPAQGLTQAEIDEEARKGATALGRDRAVSASKMKNASIVRGVDKPQYFLFRGRRLKLRPLPFEDGLKLMEVGAIVQEVRGRLETERDAVELGLAIRAFQYAAMEVVRIAHMLIRPPFVPVWFWSRWPSRLYGATRDEIFQLLNFCARCQTISQDQPENRAVS